MKIDEALRTQSFTNEWQKLRVNLLFTHGWLKCRLTDFLDQYDLSMQQFNILRILRGQYPKAISTMQIRERMIDHMSDTSRIVDRLLKKDLVAKSTCNNDKRLVDVRITGKGLEVLAAIDVRAGELDGFTKGVSEEEARKLNILLNKIRREDDNCE